MLFWAKMEGSPLFLAAPGSYILYEKNFINQSHVSMSVWCDNLYPKDWFWFTEYYIEPFLGPVGDVQSTEPSNESPILSASFPSTLVFGWFTGFAWTGFKRSLGFADLHDLPPFVQSGNVVPRFLEKWNQNKEIQPKLTPKKSSSTVKVRAHFLWEHRTILNICWTFFP